MTQLFASPNDTLLSPLLSPISLSSLQRQGPELRGLVVSIVWVEFTWFHVEQVSRDQLGLKPILASRPSN